MEVKIEVIRVVADASEAIGKGNFWLDNDTGHENYLKVKYAMQKLVDLNEKLKNKLMNADEVFASEIMGLLRQAGGVTALVTAG